MIEITPQTKAVLEALQEAAILVDSRRYIVFFNPVARDLFGNGFVGKDFVRLIRQPQCLSALSSVMEGADRAACSLDIEYPVRGSFNFAVSQIGLDNAGGPLILVSLKDMSDLKDAEQMRSDFVANVSHELRSPLTALSGFIETLRGSAKGDLDAHERFLGLMEHESQRMVRLISDLLSLAKVEASQRIRPKGHADIGAVLKRIENTLSATAKKENKTVRLVLNDTAAIPGSEDELTQVFQNLIENALKYGNPQSTVTVEVGRAQNIAGIAGEAVSVAVSDESEGIAPEHLPRLTERFYRVDTHRSRDKGGTGLGLAIVKHIVSRHRGRLRISSEAGIGSTFTVYLPMSE